MKFLSIVLLISIGSSSVFGQFKMIAQSEPFDEPTDGYSKILQLTNGNTIFLLTAKKSITVKIYDKTYHLKADNQIDKPGNEIKDVESVFEMRGDLVFFTKAVKMIRTFYTG